MELASINRIGEVTHEYDSSFDRILTTLADPIRRYAVQAMLDASGPLALADLAQDIKTENEGDPRTDLNLTAREIRIQLHHHHAPALEAAGIITYHRSQLTVEFTELGEAIAGTLQSQRVVA